jgi:hypothetical protein
MSPTRQSTKFRFSEYLAGARMQQLPRDLSTSEQTLAINHYKIRISSRTGQHLEREAHLASRAVLICSAGRASSFMPEGAQHVGKWSPQLEAEAVAFEDRPHHSARAYCGGRNCRNLGVLALGHIDAGSIAPTMTYDRMNPPSLREMAG